MRGWLLPCAIAVLAHGLIAFVPALDMTRPPAPLRVNFATSPSPTPAPLWKPTPPSRPHLDRAPKGEGAKPNAGAAVPAPGRKQQGRPRPESINRVAEAPVLTSDTEEAPLQPEPPEPARSAPDTTHLAPSILPRVLPRAPVATSRVGDVTESSEVPIKSSAGGGESIGSYARRVRRRMEQQKRYPRGARRRAQQGTAAVKLTIGADGRLLKTPALVSSSGFRLLDAEALRMAAAAQPYPRPLRTGTRNQRLGGPHGPVLITVPVRFSM